MTKSKITSNMQNPFTLTKEDDLMDHKIGQLAVKLGFVDTNGSISLPGDDIIDRLIEDFTKLSEQPEYIEIVRKRKNGEITRKQAWEELAEFAKKLDQK